MGTDFFCLLQLNIHLTSVALNNSIIQRNQFLSSWEVKNYIFPGIHIPNRPVVPDDYNLVRTITTTLKVTLQIDCKQSLIFLCKVTARKTQARELQSHEPR